jgi:hypothetical protein
MGVRYRFVDDLKVDSLPSGWDSVNHGRPVSIREEAVIEYGALMESGSPAPAVIVREADDGTLTVLDGLQRLAAAKMAGFSRFSAYVVSTDSDDTAEAIRVVANARLQGHAEPSEWTKRNAVQRLMIDRNMTAKDVAAMGGWKAADLSRLAGVLECGFQIRCIGGPESLLDGIVMQIGKFTTEDELRRAPKPIASFLHAISKGRFSVTDAGPYIEEFFQPVAKPSVYADRLEEFMATPEVETRLHGRVSPGLSTGVKLRRYLRSAIGILDTAIEEGESLDYVDEFFRLGKQIDERLRTLAPHCKAGDDVRVPADRWAK